MSHRRQRLFDSSGTPAGWPAPANQRQFAYLSCITWDSGSGSWAFSRARTRKQHGERSGGKGFVDVSAISRDRWMRVKPELIRHFVPLGLS
jgi:hypothetical protein